MITVMSDKERKRNIEKLFSQHSDGLEQATRAAVSRSGVKIASGVLDRLEEIRGGIAGLIAEGQYSPSIEAEINGLLAEQKKQFQGFEAAIKTKSIKQVRTILGWLLQIDTDLAALI